MFITAKEIVGAGIDRQEIENTIGLMDMLEQLLAGYIARLNAKERGVADEVRCRMHMLIDAQDDKALPMLLESQISYHKSLKHEYEKALKTMEKFDG